MLPSSISAAGIIAETVCIDAFDLKSECINRLLGYFITLIDKRIFHIAFLHNIDAYSRSKLIFSKYLCHYLIHPHLNSSLFFNI